MHTGLEYPIKYKLKNALEVFVRIKYTENYCISNYGRCVNNLNRKDKNTYYEHKYGKFHYTIYEIKKQIVSFPKPPNKKGRRKKEKLNGIDEPKKFVKWYLEQCGFRRISARRFRFHQYPLSNILVSGKLRTRAGQC